MMKTGLLPLCLAATLLQGCVVSTAAHLATAPIRATSWTVDKMTTSQSEADRNRGRRERQAEDKAARERRKLAREQRREAERASSPY